MMHVRGGIDICYLERGRVRTQDGVAFVCGQGHDHAFLVDTNIRLDDNRSELKLPIVNIMRVDETRQQDSAIFQNYVVDFSQASRDIFSGRYNCVQIINNNTPRIAGNSYQPMYVSCPMSAPIQRSMEM